MAGINPNLRRSDLLLNPFEQFKKWFQEAADLLEPSAMQLSTYNNGAPSIRTVLLKSFDAHGFVFYTNYESRKGHELAKNPQISLLFLWKEQERQVTIEGIASKTSRDESATYFASRPRQSQLSALTSQQGKTLSSRAELERQFAVNEKKYAGKEIPLPPFWGGFRVVPHRFEFWQGQPFRLHDRFQYCYRDGLWEIERLYP